MTRHWMPEENRSQKSEVRNQKAEGRMQSWECSGEKVAEGMLGFKFEIRSTKHETNLNNTNSIDQNTCLGF